MACSKCLYNSIAPKSYTRGILGNPGPSDKSRSRHCQTRTGHRPGNHHPALSRSQNLLLLETGHKPALPFVQACLVLSVLVRHRLRPGWKQSRPGTCPADHQAPPFQDTAQSRPALKCLSAGTPGRPAEQTVRHPDRTCGLTGIEHSRPVLEWPAWSAQRPVLECSGLEC